MTASPKRPSIHATCLVIDGKGLLIRGRSGAGKTSLALALIGAASRDGRFARLVADDRVHLEVLEGDLIGTVPSTIAGLVERRGDGVYPIDHVGRATIRLVIDLVDGDVPPRSGTAQIEGVSLPQLDIARSATPEASLVLAALDAA